MVVFPLLNYIFEIYKAAVLGVIFFVLLQGQLLLDNLVDCTKTYEFEVELTVSFSLGVAGTSSSFIPRNLLK